MKPSSSSDRWLSLTTVPDSSAETLRITVPKKIVRLATARNRIRRLIKEVVRLEYKMSAGKRYWFKVMRAPKEPDYQMVSGAVKGIWNGKE